MSYVNSSDKFGELLVRTGVVAESDVEKALQIQQNGSPDTKLGDILVEMGACSREDVEYVLERQDHLRNGGMDLKEVLSCVRNGREESTKEMQEVNGMTRDLVRKLG